MPPVFLGSLATLFREKSNRLSVVEFHQLVVQATRFCMKPFDFACWQRDQFTENGRIIVRVRPEANVTNDVVVQVEDTGIGISAEAQSRLFQPFVQADSGTTRKHGGTGLGLVICQRLVELMGGNLSLESELGQGTTFTAVIALPVAENIEVGEASPHATPPKNVLNGKRVLLVDDNKINLHVARGMLKAMGVVVDEASSAQAAKHRLTSDGHGPPFDGMIIDAMMPGTDGRDLARWVRELPGGREIPLILASSAIGSDEGRSQHDTGLFEVVLPKPLRRSALLRALATSIAKWSPAKPTPRGAHIESRRILVVEDSLVNQKVAQGFLAKDGHTVTIAENGQIALDLLTEPAAFDLILMDVQMPVMGGLETTRRLRQLEKERGWPHWPVMALSGNAMEEEHQECLSAGMDGCLTKPMNMKEVQALVAETPKRS